MTIEFNVALNGEHFFATHERSCSDSRKANRVKEALLKKFPEAEGYKVTATMNPQRGYGIDLSKDMSGEVNRILTSL